MLFAKYIDKENIIECPKNGYVGNKAISNLNIYFEKHPDIAKQEGYLKFIPSADILPGEDTENYKPIYELNNDIITERTIEIDY